MTQDSSRVASVCIVAPIPPPHGGMSVQAERLIAHLVREGIRVEVVATNPPLPGLLSWLRRVPGLRTLVRELHYTTRLARKIPACEVVHHLSASEFYFFMHSVPVLLLGHCFNRITILNYRGGNAAYFLRRWHWCVVPLMRLASSVTVPSEFLRQVFAEYGIESSLLPNLADTELFRWKEREQFAPKLLVTRNLEPVYNLECLLRAFRLVQERFPGAVLSIAGEGSQENRLRSMSARLGLRGVRFCGRVEQRDLPAVYARHDICVNSSRVDNFPGALVEAACSGLPIVTTRAGGIVHMIRDRETGILVDLDDDAALAAGVAEIIENPKLGCRLARQARSWAEQFSWKHIMPVLLASYGWDAPLQELHVAESQEVA